MRRPFWERVISAFTGREPGHAEPDLDAAEAKTARLMWLMRSQVLCWRCQDNFTSLGDAAHAANGWEETDFGGMLFWKCPECVSEKKYGFDTPHPMRAIDDGDP
jgi:hypothetical protein